MEKNSPLTREIVFQKAMELAASQGIDGITYNGLARELGIRPQSMYRYVSNLKDLRVGLLRSLLMELVSSLTEAVSIGSREETIRQFAVTLYDQCHEKPVYYEAFNLMHTYRLIDEMEEPLRVLTGLVHRLFAGMFGDKAAEDRYEQLFMAMNLGYAQMAMTQFFSDSMRDDRERFLAAVNDFIDFLSQRAGGFC